MSQQNVLQTRRFGQIAASGQLSIIIHPGSLFPEIPEGTLPRATPDTLGRIWRNELQDLPPNRGVLGIRAPRIAQLGLKYSPRNMIFKNSELVIPKDTPLIATRNAAGKIVALSTPNRWLTRPSIHCANLIRRHWLQQIEVFPSVLMADLNAVERNIAAVCMGGVDLAHLSQRVTGANPRTIAEMECAA